MSDYRGPTAGLGDEPPDVVPRTGPPTEPVVPAPSEQPALAEATSEPLETTPEDAAAEIVERPAEEVLEPTVAQPPVVYEPAAPPEPLLSEEGQRAHVRDVLVIEPAALVPEQIAASPVAAATAGEEAPIEVLPEAEAPLSVLSHQTEQLPAEELPTSSAADARPVESLTADIADYPTEPAAETVAADEAPIEATSPRPLPPPSLPVDEEPRAAALAPEPEPTIEAVAETPPPAPLLPLPQTIPVPAFATPAIVRALRAPEPVPQVESAAAIAATETLAVPPPPPPPPIATVRSRSVWPGRLRRAALTLVGLVVGYAVLVLALIFAYRWIDPPRSTLMIANHLTGEPVLYAPVPITNISPYLQRAVVTSEDARFCYHRGVDWAALYEAINESRGGSTITMQTAKNLFLWPSRSYIRKAIEIPVAMTIDAFWPKRRILEVYLNIAEWGPGIFGAEAAAQYHFSKSASRLTAHEATLLAASLPNPIARDAGEPGRVTAILASRLRARLTNSDAFVSCLGLRSLRPAPLREPRREPKTPQKAAPKAATTKTEPQIPPWRTTTDPAFNPWQN